MSSTTTRYGVLAALLALIWVGVYWWTPPLSRTSPPVQRDTEIVAIPTSSDPPPTPPVTGPDEETVTDPADEEPAPDADEGPAEPVPDLVPVVPPEFIDYVVRPNDNAHRISKHFYGTTSHYRSIMRANPGVSFDRLRAGRSIRVPKDPHNVQGLPIEDTSPGDASEDPVVTYTVRTGDTLSDIAKTVYGKASLWRLIRDANTEQLRRRDGTDIRPGMVLVIPPAPTPSDD